MSLEPTIDELIRRRSREILRERELEKLKGKSDDELRELAEVKPEPFSVDLRDIPIAPEGAGADLGWQVKAPEGVSARRSGRPGD